MEQKNNSGSLYRNNKKEKEIQPDYTGTVTVDAKRYKIAGWLNKSKSGGNYLRLLFSELKEQDINTASVQAQMPLTPQNTSTDLVDDLPF